MSNKAPQEGLGGATPQDAVELNRRDLLLTGSSLAAAAALPVAGVVYTAQAQPAPAQPTPQAQPTPVPATTRPGGRRPNFVVIMTDDVGWGDLGSYGGGAMRGAPTPQPRSLAAEGMRFVNYYGQASCTAGRASFITGRIPIRTSLSARAGAGRSRTASPSRRRPSRSFCGRPATRRCSSANGISATTRRTSRPPTGSTRCTTCCPITRGLRLRGQDAAPEFSEERPEVHENLAAARRAREFEGKAGEQAKMVKANFDYNDLETGDDIMRARAVDWIKAHARDQKPFFMYLNFLKVHNPNNPSARWKGKSPGGGVYLDALMELDDNSGQILQAIRDARHRREHARGVDDRQRRLDRRLARRRLHAVPRHEGHAVRGRLPRAGASPGGPATSSRARSTWTCSRIWIGGRPSPSSPASRRRPTNGRTTTAIRSSSTASI